MAHPLINIATDAARKAGNIMLRALPRLDRIVVSTKAKNDYVSEIDLACEQAIIQTIHESYPDHQILAEESGHQSSDSDIKWIIDPLDGTKNFIHGFPHFAVSIGIEVNGKLEHGVIFDPVKNELFAASRGQGATLNNTKIRVSKVTRLEQALIGTGFPYTDFKDVDNYLQVLKTIITTCGGIRRPGSAALDLAYVAAGRLDGFWEFNLKPWDMAAGIVLIREAGGLLTDLEGKSDYFDSGMIVTAPPKLIQQFLTTLQSSMNG